MRPPFQWNALRWVLITIASLMLAALAIAGAHVSPYGCGAFFDRYSLPHVLVLTALTVGVCVFLGAAATCTRPAGRAFSIRTLLVIAATIVALAICEMLLSVSAAADIITDPKPSIDDLIYENHPVFGHWLKPNFTFVSGAHRVTTDSRGVIVRRPQENFAAPPGTRRVMLVGDSLVEGYQIESELNLSLHLERRLNAGTSAPQYHVLNLGKGGFSPIKYLLVFRHFAPQYRPDLVVTFVYFTNDVMDDAQIAANGRIISDGTGNIVRLWPEVDYWKREVWTPWGGSVPLDVREDESFWGRLRTMALVRKEVVEFCDAVYGLEAADAPLGATPSGAPVDEFAPQVPVRSTPYAMFKSSFDEEDRNDINRTLTYLERMEREVRGAGAQMILVIIPDKVQVSDRQPGVTRVVDSPRPHEIFTSFAKQHGIDYVDLLPVLKEHGNEVLFLADSHFNARGHEVVGEELGRAILQIELKSGR